MSVMIRRPRCSCGHIALRGRSQCASCQAADTNLGLGPLRDVPIVKPADIPSTAWCRFCARGNTPEYTDSMYLHDEGRFGRWWAHVGCETQHEWDRYEGWRDTRDDQEGER